jgi:hypothetical protein
MFDETLIVVPPARQQELKAVVEQPAPQLHDVDQSLTAPTAERIKAVEAVFSQQEKESRAVAGLIGLWTGTLLLHDLAVETFDEPADEKEEQLKPEKKPHSCC